MRITVVQGAFLPVPPIRGGAVEKVWHSLAEEFASRGHQVVHFSRSFPGLPAEEAQGTLVRRRVRGSDASGLRLVYRLQDLMFALRVQRVLPAADILVTHSIWLPVFVRSARSGRLYVNVNRMPKGQMRLYQHAARLQAVSEAVAESIGREVPACLPKVRVIPNALPSSFVRASQAASNVVERRNVILYAGRIHPEKGIDLLVNAFETLPPDVRSGWQLWIMGPSEATGGGAGGAYREGLRRSAVKSRDSIRWLEPAYADEDLARRYTEAKIFVYPSVAERGESFGMAPLEAMLCGCAVIVSRLRCFSEFLEEGVNGLSFNHAGASAVADLSNQLRRLMQQPELGRSLAERAAVNAMKFSAESVAERHLLDFEELLSGVVPAPVRA